MQHVVCALASCECAAQVPPGLILVPGQGKMWIQKQLCCASPGSAGPRAQAIMGGTVLGPGSTRSGALHGASSEKAGVRSWCDLSSVALMLMLSADASASITTPALPGDMHRVHECVKAPHKIMHLLSAWCPPVTVEMVHACQECHIAHWMTEPHSSNLPGYQISTFGAYWGVMAHDRVHVRQQGARSLPKGTEGCRAHQRWGVTTLVSHLLMTHCMPSPAASWAAGRSSTAFWNLPPRPYLQVRTCMQNWHAAELPFPQTATLCICIHTLMSYYDSQQIAGCHQHSGRAATYCIRAGWNA